MDIKLVGHGTVLVRSENTTLLVDPFFWLDPPPGSRAAQPMAMGAREAAYAADGVLVTHGGFGHFDRRFFNLLETSVPVLVPQGFRGFGREPQHLVLPVSHWQSTTIGDIRITAVPARHSGCCCGYVAESRGRSVYLAGNTRHAPFMAELRRRFSVGTAVLPVRQMRLAGALSPREALAATKDLGAKRVVFVHRDAQSVLNFFNLPRNAEKCALAVQSALPHVEALLPSNGDVLCV